MHERVRTASTWSAPGSFCRKASRAEASRTALVTGLFLGFLPALGKQLLGERDAGRGDVGEVRLHVADHRVQWAEDDTRLGRLEYDGIAGLDAVCLAEFGGDGNAACLAQL